MPPPTLFDDEGESPADPPTPDIAAGPGGDGRPNYLARRAIVVGAVVVVIAVVAIVVGRLIGGEGGGDTSGAASTEWNRVVLVEPRTGEVTVHDDAGDEVDVFDSDVTAGTDSRVVQATALVTSETNTAILDLDSGAVEQVEIGADTIVEPSGSTLTMIAPAITGRRGLIVHGPSGEAIDTDEFAPVSGANFEFDVARSDPSGRQVLVTDSGNFQSVLFSFDRDEPSYFPGLALAIDDTTVVTAQNVGNDATISIFDHSGEALASGRTTSVRAAMLSDDRVQLVTVDGQIVSMDLGSGETDDGSVLEIGTVEYGVVMTTGDRLVVAGSDGSAVLDADGSVVYVSVEAVPFPDESTLRGSTCIALDRADSDGGRILVVVDARDGSTVAEADLERDSVVRSADGCTVAIPLDPGYDVVDAEGVTSIGDDVLVALAPNGLDAVVDRERTLVLTPIATDDADDEVDPIDLGTRGRQVSFTEL